MTRARPHRRRRAASPWNRLGALPPLIAAATAATIGLDWIGVLVALAILAALLLIGVRRLR